MTTAGAQPPEFLVDRFLPAGEVHLLYGPYNEETTLFALQALTEWLRGAPVLGQHSHPQPACYVACDHSLDSLRRDMRCLNLDPSHIPHLSLVGRTRREDRTVDSALNFARELVPRLRFLVLDGMYALCPGKINDYHDSSNFLIATSETCKRQSLTILGCVPTVKTRDGEGYSSPRDRLHGSGAWAGIPETKILLEPNRIGRHDDGTRTVTIISRRFSTKTTLQYAITDGRFELLGEGFHQTDLDQWLANQAPDTTFTSQDLRNVAETLQVSKSALYRWLTDQLTMRTLVRLGQGCYATPSTAPLAH